MAHGVASFRAAFNALCCAMAGIAVVSPAVAQSGTEPAQPVNASAAEPAAIVWDSSLVVDTHAVVAGRPSAARAVARAIVGATFDGAAARLPGLSANVMFGAYSGAGLSGRIEDLQGISNIAAPQSMVRPLNAWVMWQGPRIGLKAGIIDTNADFDEQNVGAPFVQSSHGMGAEMASAGLDGSGPAPYSALGVIGFVGDEARGWKLRVGVFGGEPGDPDRPSRWYWPVGGHAGILTIAEADWQRPGLRLAIGGWHNSARLPLVDGEGTARGTGGVFGLVEGTLAGTPASDDTAAASPFRLDGWVRGGVARSETAVVRDYIGGGLVAYGLSRSRPDDALGIAFSRAHAAASPQSHETDVELTYQFNAGRGVTLQPNIHWLVNPGADPDRADLLVAGLRLIFVP